MNQLQFPDAVLTQQIHNYGAVEEPNMWVFPVPLPSLPPVPYEPSLSHFQETVCSICMQE